MPDSPAGPSRLVLDHELLWRLGPHTPLPEWEKTLRRAGLWSLTTDGSPEGELVADLQRALQVRTPSRPDPSALPRWATIALGALGAGGLALAATDSAVAGLVAAAAVPTLAWGWAARAPEVTPASTAHAARLLRQLLARTFVHVAGEVVVENLPHRDYLALRVAEVERARVASERRSAELEATLASIRLANTRIGRAPDDAQTAALTAAAQTEAQSRAHIAEVCAHLHTRLATFDAELDRLRALAERRALSERASRLTDGAGADLSLREAAALELDVVSVEREVAALKLDVRDQDARLRAVLEVVGADRRGP